MTVENPWRERLAHCAGQESIRIRAILKPDPLLDLELAEPEFAITRLATTFDNCYYASDRACAIIAELLSRARIGATARYDSRLAFLKALYDGEIPCSHVEPVCLTGLAGIGKTELLRACERVLPQDSFAEIDPWHDPFPVQAMWRLQLTARQALRPMLAELAKQAGASDIPKTMDRIQELLRKLAYRNGVALLAADEMQFATQGSTANSIATRMLLNLRALGCPMVYCANFSLGHRLKCRNQEDRQRLLGGVITLDREDIDSHDWSGLIDFYCDLAPQVFQLDPNSDAPALWRLTAGIPRMLKQLLVSTYINARRRNKYTVTLEDCERTYRSSGFGVMREDIEHLATQAITGQPTARRPDLNNPFPQECIAPPQATESIIDAQTRKHVEQLQRDGLNASELLTLKTMETNNQPKNIKSQANNARNDDLMSNLDYLKGSIRHK